MEEKDVSGIYKIYCKENDKTYIGQSCDISRRFAEHKKRLKSQKMKHNCVYLENAWNLYGPDAFEFSIIEECSNDKLNEREQHYFDLYGKEKLFNIALCAEAPGRGRKVSEETKQKLRELNTGKNNPNYGKKISEEHKKILSESKKGEKHWHYGRPCTEEEKLKNSLSHRGDKTHLAKLTWEQIRKIRYDFENDVKNVSQISEELEMDKSNIYEIIKGNTWKEDSYVMSDKSKTKLEQAAHIVNPEIVKQIREEYKTSTLQLKDLSKKYGMSVSGFGKIIRNEIWIDDQYGQWMKDNIAPVKKPTRINFEIAQQIRSDFDKEYGQFNKEKGYIEIAQRYNLASITVRKIIKNKLWTK
jgi:group I intron endonuclease